jgi:hypothetical protein
MEAWDTSDSSDIVIYKFKIGFMTYLAEVEILKETNDIEGLR